MAAENPAPPKPAKSGDGFDQLLEDRFRPENRREMARQIAARDQAAPGEKFDKEHVRRRVRFHGAIPDRVKGALREWVPDLLAFAAAHGLGLRDLNHEIHFYDPPAFRDSVGKIPKGMSLPASSFLFNQLYRVYTVRVVLPPTVQSTAQVMAVLRALLKRMIGDIFLREEVYVLEPFREDAAQPDEETSVGLTEKIALLAGEEVTPPELGATLAAYGQAKRMNFKRSPQQVRKAFFREVEQEVERQALSPKWEALIESTFQVFLEQLRERPAEAIAEVVAAVEKSNAQLNFLPPDELPDYLQLRQNNALHYLRAANLRLAFLLEMVGSVLEDFSELEAADGAVTPMAEDRLDGFITRLRSEGLARPYLVPDAHLSEELARKKAAFPLEVHALMSRMPPAKNPEKAFKALSKRVENSFYQRLYNALLITHAFLRARRMGRREAFLAGERYKTLTGLMANFKFRRPLLEALFVKIGIVLDFAESRHEPGEAKPLRRFPLQAFRRSWGQFIPHALIAEYFGGAEGAPGFDAGSYWQKADATFRAALGGETGNLVYLLRRIHAEASGEGLRDGPGARPGEGLRVLAELLKNPSGTFRFSLGQALAATSGESPGEAEELSARLEKWAALVLTTRAAGLKHAIPPSGDP